MNITLPLTGHEVHIDSPEETIRIDDVDNNSHDTVATTSSADANRNHSAVPSWSQELASSRVGRHSRASSIISTTTRLTVSTTGDARSIEIQAGGQSFRINRFGSAITDVTAPPPYPGSPETNSLFEDPSDAASATSVETEIALPDHHNLETELGDGATTHTTQQRGSQNTRTYQVQSLFVIPQSLRRALGLTSSTSTLERLPISPHDQATSSTLRRTQSDSSDFATWRQASLNTHTDDFTQGGVVLPPHALNRKGYESGTNLPSNQTASLFESEDEYISEISNHYNGLMREVDRDYRRRLHEKEKDLARLRELLNEKDIVYRQQLRERNVQIDNLDDLIQHKDKTINELKTKLYEMEQVIESKVERAQHTTEDMWEKRWKEYEKLLLERLIKSRRGSVAASDEEPDMI